MNPARSHLQCVAGTPSAEALAWVASAPELARRAALGDFGDEVLAWLAEGFSRYVVGGDVPLEAALRLDRASRIRARNDALRCAAALLSLCDEGPWSVAGRLAQAVARHERKRSQPETPLESAVAAAFAAGECVPATQRQLYQIIY